MSIKIYPYRAGSRSARALADALEARVLRREGSRYVRRDGDLIINWGASDCPYTGRGVANQPDAIESASNKLKCFRLMDDAGVSVPAFTEDRGQAADWLEIEGNVVMCRTKLQGHSGDGIVVAERGNQLVNAPLYTAYVKKKDEYRVHCIRMPGGATQSIIIQRKAKRHGVENADFKVRNLANGFVYIISGDAPDQVQYEAFKALEATGLAFGAVDVIWNEHQNKAYVLEINTAPGLEDRTARAYADKFNEIYRGM